MRFFSPDTDREALDQLVHLCQRQDHSALWWQIVPTIVVEREGGPGLVGYAQFSLGDTTLYLYGMGVHPEERRAGLGRRLLAERLHLGAVLGASRAIGRVDAANTPMRLLFAQAKFTPTDLTEDGMRYISTLASFAWAAEHVGTPVEAEAG